MLKGSPEMDCLFFLNEMILYQLSEITLHFSFHAAEMQGYF